MGQPVYPAVFTATSPVRGFAMSPVTLVNVPTPQTEVDVSSLVQQLLTPTSNSDSQGFIGKPYQPPTAPYKPPL